MKEHLRSNGLVDACITEFVYFTNNARSAIYCQNAPRARLWLSDSQKERKNLSNEMDGKKNVVPSALSRESSSRGRGQRAW